MNPGGEPARTSDDAPDDGLLAECVAEVAARIGRGEPVDLEAYADRHPGAAGELRRLLPTIKLMAGLGEPSPGPDTDGLPNHGPWPEHGGDPQRLGDFHLLRVVGRGGMGVVYEAVQVSLRRRVALKVLPFAAALDERQLLRFHVEAQAAAGLRHNYIVPVFATGMEHGVPFYAMQFIDGKDLAQVISDGGLGRAGLVDCDHVRAAVELGRQAAEALDFAHRNDVLHRDVKPSNLMVDTAGGLWITDFGLARVRGDLGLTGTGEMPGTPRFMSPEQALGRTPLDGRADVYALGTTLYELLTGQPAFDGEDCLEVLRQIARESPRPI
jgi:serine/threonine protein kinase